MNVFPDFIRNAMRSSGAAATCVPVQFGRAEWEAAVFFHIAGPESKLDRRQLRRTDGPVPIGLSVDVIEHANAAVGVLGLEVHATLHDPLVGEVLLTPGGYESHFDTLRCLSTQPLLHWFFGDQDFRVIHDQGNRLGDAEHREFAEAIERITRHDAVVRLTGRYDASLALADVASHYEVRTGPPPPATGIH